MTVGLAYRIPGGGGCVLATDGRVTDSSSSDILSDAEKKYVVCGNTVVLVAGSLGKLWLQLQDNPPKNFKALRAKIGEHADSDTEWLAYDRTADRLYLGDVAVTRPIAGIGCGASFGLGALEALPYAKTMDAAYKHISTAMAIACRRNASCGGRIRILVIPRKGPIQHKAPSGTLQEPKEPKD